MSKLKKYILLFSGVLSFIYGLAMLMFFIPSVFNFSEIFKKLIYLYNNLNTNLSYEALNNILIVMLAYVCASSVLCGGFGIYIIIISFLSPEKFEKKKNLVNVMAILSFFLLNIFVIIIFIGLMLTDKNLNNSLITKMKLLTKLKEKSYISNNEFITLTNNIENF